MFYDQPCSSWDIVGPLKPPGSAAPRTTAQRFAPRSSRPAGWPTMTPQAERSWRSWVVQWIQWMGRYMEILKKKMCFFAIWELIHLIDSYRFSFHHKKNSAFVRSCVAPNAGFYLNGTDKCWPKDEDCPCGANTELCILATRCIGCIGSEATAWVGGGSWKFGVTVQCLVNVPFWGFWTSQTKVLFVGDDTPNSFNSWVMNNSEIWHLMVFKCPGDGNKTMSLDALRWGTFDGWSYCEKLLRLPTGLRSGREVLLPDVLHAWRLAEWRFERSTQSTPTMLQFHPIST